jgi:hypothetical protein
MADTITLSDGVTTLDLPDLLWEDEDDWDPVDQARSVSVEGSEIVEDWPARESGRPISLRGGERLAWLTKTEKDAIKALGAPAGVQLTLTLLDDSSYTVTPRRDPNEPWLEVRQLPKVIDSGVVDPQPSAKYILEWLRFVEIQGT